MNVVERHFAAENAHDVQATLDTYTDDIIWDDITHPDSPFHGKEEVGQVYGGIIEAIPDILLTSVRRFESADGRFVTDE
jgi:ketosteroid isomerase-like protein